MKEYLHKYFYILGEKKKYLWILILFFLVSSVFELASIGLIGPFVSAIVNPNELQELGVWISYKNVIGFEEDRIGLLIFGLIIIVAFYVKGWSSFWIYKKIINFAYQHQVDLRTKLMSLYQAMPYFFHIRRNSASLINVINVHVTSYTNSLLVSSLRMVADIIIFMIIAGVLLYTNAIATLSLLALLLSVFYIYNLLVRNQIEDSGKDLANASRDIIKGITHGITGLKEIRVLGRERFFTKTVNNESKNYASAGMKYYALQIIPRYLIESAMITFVIILASITLLFSDDVGYLFATLGVFSVAALRLMPAAVVVIGGINSIRNTKHVLNELYDDLRLISKLQNNHSNLSLEESDTSAGEASTIPFSEINIDNISYQYPGSDQWAISKLSMKIRRGQSIGLIGKSGAGKTTLVDLLLGLYEPQKGEITVDGESIYKNIRGWLDNVAYIPQDVFLVDDTLKNNIALGVKTHDISEEKLLKAIKLAQLQEVVSNMPEGVQTVVGERGVRLSGGQKQRVALARAFYHERNVLVLDEATAALDNDTEKEVVKAIESLKGEKTLIVIAHRLTTVEKCDFIYKMEKGKIIDSGSFDRVVNSIEVSYVNT